MVQPYQPPGRPDQLVPLTQLGEAQARMTLGETAKGVTARVAGKIAKAGGLSSATRTLIGRGRQRHCSSLRWHAAVHPVSSMGIKCSVR
jgi:hypothetical protein